MQDYEASDGCYIAGPASVYPAYPINMSARDLARFALLYLHHGKWQQHQIVPAHWVEASTQPYSQSDLLGLGYGYLWWTRSMDSSTQPLLRLPFGTFFAMGAGGQFAFVIAAYDLIVVRRGPSSLISPRLQDISRLLQLVFDAGNLSDVR
jgi:CubicO group peptidase (beta-lactamase class C family)